MLDISHCCASHDSVNVVARAFNERYSPPLRKRLNINVNSGGVNDPNNTSNSGGSGSTGTGTGIINATINTAPLPLIPPLNPIQTVTPVNTANTVKPMKPSNKLKPLKDTKHVMELDKLILYGEIITTTSTTTTTTDTGTGTTTTSKLISNSVPTITDKELCLIFATSKMHKYVKIC